MSIPEFNNLFHNSGPQETLDFLLSKIEVNDLSPEEALAMLSLVHEELGEGKKHDPKVFQSYNNFMKFLQREKPELYDYVVSAWKKRSENVSAVEESQNVNLDETVTDVSSLQKDGVRPDAGFEEVKASGEVATEAEDPQESGEEEKPIIEGVKDNEIDERPDEEVKVEEQNETEEDVSEDNEGKAEEQVDSNIDDENDATEETDSDEGQDDQPEKEEPEDEQELNGNDASPDEGSQDVENDESNSEPEKSETENEPESEQSESEWPEIEESTQEDPLNGTASEEGDIAGED